MTRGVGGLVGRRGVGGGGGMGIFGKGLKTNERREPEEKGTLPPHSVLREKASK